MHHSQTVSKGLVKDGLGKGLCGQIHPFLLSLNAPPHTVRDLPESRAAWKGESLHPQRGMWGVKASYSSFWCGFGPLATPSGASKKRRLSCWNREKRWSRTGEAGTPRGPNRNLLSDGSVTFLSP